MENIFLYILSLAAVVLQYNVCKGSIADVIHFAKPVDLLKEKNEDITQHIQFFILFGSIGDLILLLVLLEPILAMFWKIIKKRITQLGGIEELGDATWDVTKDVIEVVRTISMMPCVISMLDFLLLIWYNMPFISKDSNIYSSYADIVGLILEFIYLVIYFKFVIKSFEEAIPTIWKLGVVLVIFSVITYLTGLAIKPNLRYLRRGIAGCAILFSSTVNHTLPFWNMMETGGLEVMPIQVSFLTFGSSVCWCINVYVDGDKFVYIPNGIVAVLSFCHIVLYIHDRCKRGGAEGEEMQVVQRENQETQKNEEMGPGGELDVDAAPTGGQPLEVEEGLDDAPIGEEPLEEVDTRTALVRGEEGGCLQMKEIELVEEKGMGPDTKEGGHSGGPDDEFGSNLPLEQQPTSEANPTTVGIFCDLKIRKTHVLQLE